MLLMRGNAEHSCWCERGLLHLDHIHELINKPEMDLQIMGYGPNVVASYRRCFVLVFNKEGPCCSRLVYQCVLFLCGCLEGGFYVGEVCLLTSNSVGFDSLG
jgi:hypothetical protein